MTYPLALKTLPGSEPAEQGYLKTIQEAFATAIQQTGVQAEVSADEPDPDFDLWYLQDEFLPDDPDAIDEFEAFCEANGLVPYPLTGELASKFLAYRGGSSIATIELPEDPEEAAQVFRATKQFALKHGLAIEDLQHRGDVDLNSDENLPAGW